MLILFETVGDEPERCPVTAGGLLQEPPHGKWFGNFRDNSFQRLLGGGKGDAAGPVGLVHLALGTVTDQGHNPVYTHFGGLFHEPFEPFIVLGGAAAYREPVRPGIPIRMPFNDSRFGSFGIVVREAADIHRPFSVDDMDEIPRPVPEHPHAVRAFFGIQAADGRSRFICIEQFHRL